MGCFLCASKSSSSTNANQSAKNRSKIDAQPKQRPPPPPPPDSSKMSMPQHVKEESEVVDVESNTSLNPSSGLDPDKFKARKFTLSELVAATENFKEDYLLGSGGFGKVYKGCLKPSGEIVAIKRLDRSGNQGIREFVVEVLTLSNAKHDNLVKLNGYCAEGDQRLLVYEYMPLGSLEEHLHGSRSNRKNMNWNTRMKIAACVVQGLDYMHNQMKPPVIYRDLKSSNILLGEDYLSKLSDFGLAKVGPSGDETHVSTRVMGTYGYCAPDYFMTGQLTFKSDVYSFGVLLLEIITGRRAINQSKKGPDQNLVEWARPLFKDRRKFHLMVDPELGGEYPSRGLYQVLAIAAMCTQEDPDLRPDIADVVTALTYISSQRYDANARNMRDTFKMSGRDELNLLSPKLEG